MYPELFPRRLERLPPDQWVVYVRIGDAPYFYSAGLAGVESEEAVAYRLGERSHLAVIESNQSFKTWPRCPSHKIHALSPEIVNDKSVWRCRSDPPTMIPIGRASEA
jgi:hypothetical protein